MKIKSFYKKNNKEIYIVQEKTKLKNVIVSNKDPYEEILLSTKDDIWYHDSLEY